MTTRFDLNTGKSVGIILHLKGEQLLYIVDNKGVNFF